MKNKLLGLVTVLLLFSLFLSACATKTTTTTQATTPTKTTSVTTTTSATQTSTPAKTTTTTATTPTPLSGGTLKIITSDVTSMGIPAEGPTQNGMMVARSCCENLLQLDTKGNVLPWLATGIQWGSDYKSVTFTLRKNVKFHDGTDFDATAVKFCLDMVKSSKRTELARVSSIEVVDDYTIRLNLTQYDAVLLRSLTGLAGKIVSPTAFKKMGADAAATNPVGTGPFQIVSYQRDVSVKFKKFSGYWQPGKPYLDNLEFILIKDPVTARIALLSGEAQILFRCSAKDASDLQASGNYLINKTPGGVTGIAGDSKNIGSPFSDIKVRQALAYALNNAAIAKAMGYGTYEAANQFVPSVSQTYNTAVVGYPFNVQKAKELLAQEGFPNLKTKITFNNTQTDLWTIVQGYFKDAGITLDLDAADSARWSQVASQPWSNQLLAFQVNETPAISMGDALNNSMATNSRSNPSIYIPDEYQSMLDQAIASTDPQKSQDIFRQMELLIIDKYCMALPIYASYQTTAVLNTVRDCNVGVIAGHVWDPENVWISGK